jgi:hypothetical protein
MLTLCTYYNGFHWCMWKNPHYLTNRIAQNCWKIPFQECKNWSKRH